MLCAIAKMAVLGAFGTEKVIFPYRIVGLAHFYLFPYMVTCKMVDFRQNSALRPRKGKFAEN